MGTACTNCNGCKSDQETKLEVSLNLVNLTNIILGSTRKSKKNGLEKFDSRDWR